MVALVHTLPGCEHVLPIYEVDDAGVVYSHSKTKKGTPMKQSRNQRGYCLVGLKTCDGSYYNALVHRLVALAFVPGFEHGLQVDHLDGNKSNNTPSNLAWVTPRQNTHNPITFQRFVRQNRKSHKAVPIEVCNVQTGMVTVYPSACAAAKAIGYKSNSFLISPTKGYKTIGHYVVRRLDL